MWKPKSSMEGFISMNTRTRTTNGHIIRHSHGNCFWIFYSNKHHLQSSRLQPREGRCNFKPFKPLILLINLKTCHSFVTGRLLKGTKNQILFFFYINKRTRTTSAHLLRNSLRNINEHLLYRVKGVRTSNALILVYTNFN